MTKNTNMPKVKICQYGVDGFGHQLEGTLRLISMSLNGKADYQYNHKKTYSFEHNNFNIKKLTTYFLKANDILQHILKKNTNETYKRIKKERRSFEQIIKDDHKYEKNLYLYDGVPGSIKIPLNFEKIEELEKSLPILRKAFVKKNNILPPPSFNKQCITVVCHLRLGDAIGQRVLDTENLIKVIRHYQKNNKYRIIIHTNGDVNHLKHPNTTIYSSNTDVLQVLSDFIHANILIINFSSLSIAGHLLGNKKQTVICPSNANETFKPRILHKCIPCEEFLKNNR